MGSLTEVPEEEILAKVREDDYNFFEQVEFDFQGYNDRIQSIQQKMGEREQRLDQLESMIRLKETQISQETIQKYQKYSKRDPTLVLK